MTSTKSHRTLYLALAALLLAFGLAACGGGGGEGSGSTAAEAGDRTQSQGGAGDAGSKQGEAKGGKGGEGESEGSSGKGEAAEFTPKPHNDSGGGSQQYVQKGGDNSVQGVGESFEKLAAQAKQLKDTSCAGILEKLTNPAAKSAMKQEAEKANVGSLRVEGDRSFGISPHALPRKGTAPVSVTVDSSFATADESDPPPQLRRIAIAINRGGRIFDRGLPTCRVQRIQPSTIAAAKRICGGAIVGNGHVQVRVNLANQPPFTFKGPMLVFHATRAGGKRRLLAQVYGTRPPSAFVLTFKILRRKGTFGTVISTVLPKPARKWAYVTHFEMKLRRIYTYRGRRRSFISAGCAAPAGFPGAVYPFARANFGFAGGSRGSGCW